MSKISLSEELQNYRNILTETPTKEPSSSLLLNEKWDTKMHTAKKDKGMWDGWSVAELKSELSRLKKKEEKTTADKKREKQVMFAIRAKQKDKFGKIKESSTNSLTEDQQTSLDDIIANHKEQVQEFINGTALFELKPLLDNLYEYYLPEMPYGVAKARTGDPDVWISEKLSDYLTSIGYITERKHPLQKAIDAGINEGWEEVSEKWDTDYETPKSKRGMFKGRAKESLKAELEKLKKNPNKTEALKKKEHELEFALRAKNKFGKIKESGPFSKNGSVSKKLSETKKEKKCKECGKKDCICDE